MHDTSCIRNKRVLLPFHKEFNFSLKNAKEFMLEFVDVGWRLTAGSSKEPEHHNSAFRFNVIDQKGMKDAHVVE